MVIDVLTAWHQLDFLASFAFSSFYVVKQKILYNQGTILKPRIFWSNNFTFRADC